jgi:hypothetical protein
VIYDNEPRAIAVNARAQAIKPGVPAAVAPIPAPAATAVSTVVAAADAASSATGEKAKVPASSRRSAAQ